MVEKEQTVSIFDPARNAFFECTIEKAKKFIKSAKEVEAKIVALEVKNKK